jgi:peptidoglycan/LPS O-acetylase OafA/YrhL
VTPLILGLLLVAWCAVAIEPYRTGGVWAASGAYLLIEVFGYSLAFSLIVLAMLNLERSGALKAQTPLVPFLILIGDASYVLYLFNYLFMVAVWKALLHVHLPADLLWLYMACASAACVLGAVLIHLAIERPYLRFAGRAVRAITNTLRLPRHGGAVEEIPKT